MNHPHPDDDPFAREDRVLEEAPEPEAAPEEPAASGPPDADDIRELVARLARPHRSGGRVVERASLLAEGADFAAVMAWIEANGGEAEVAAAPKAARGLHSARTAVDTGAARVPLRFVVPASALQ